MYTGKQGKVDGIGYGLVIGTFSFAPNGSSNPLLTAVGGGLTRFITGITYGATGVYTVQFGTDFVFANAPVFHVVAQPDSLANWFIAQQIGQYNTTTRQLVIQAHRSGAGYEPAASSGCRIRSSLYALDTTGK